MLFGRSAHYAFVLLAMTAIAANENLDHYRKQGKSLGWSSQRSELSKEEQEAITPRDLRGQTFDGEQARKQLDSTMHQEVKNLPSQDLDPNILSVVENVEHSMKNQKGIDKPEAEIQETIEKCLIENEIVSVTVNHNLAVEVIHTPRVFAKYKVCKGHRSEIKCDGLFEPIEIYISKKREFSLDPTIKTYDVTFKERGTKHHDLIISCWTHLDDAHTCESSLEYEREISAESWAEIDVWETPEDLLDSLNCTLINTTFGLPETRIIEGHEVKRPHWNKFLHLQCINPLQNECHFLKEKNCIFSSESCIKQIGSQCLIWEKLFKCRTRQGDIAMEPKDTYGVDPKLWSTEYKPNQSFPDVATKLAVFDEMKKELQKANATSGQSVRLFTGSEQRCSKSLAENIMYDCCFDMDGFTTQVKLSKCTADEIALAESRQKGLCHYLGKKKEKFLNLWVSRTEHIFCVFPSKLSRVFQEEARKQLNIAWGDVHNPNCRGLTQDEIKRLDFSKLNLLEAFEAPKNIDSEEKVKKIEERLKQRIEAL